MSFLSYIIDLRYYSVANFVPTLVLTMAFTPIIPMVLCTLIPFYCRGNNYFSIIYGIRINNRNETNDSHSIYNLAIF